MDKKGIIYFTAGIFITIIGNKIIKTLRKNNQKQIKEIIHSDEHLNEQLVRNIQFFGNQGQQKIEQSHIIVFGCGGVGSHVISAIIRAGVKKITIIDFDRITLSSLNRHAIATRKDVGISKVEIFEQFVKNLNPTIELKTIEAYVKVENLNEFFQGEKPDYVIDCIDNIDAKTALAVYCIQNELKLIVCCGAGMKCDPTRIQIRDISDSQNDDLARALRMRLKKHNIKSGFNVVYSTELNDKQLLPLQEHQKINPDDYRVMPNYRLRIVPVFGCMPALFAYSLASYVLTDIAGQPPKTYFQNDIKMPYFIQQIQLLNQQAKKNKVDINVDIEDLIVIYKAYNGKCLIKDKKARPLEFIQFNSKQDIDALNIILLSNEEAKKYKEGTLEFSQEQNDRKKQYDILIQENLGNRIFV